MSVPQVSQQQTGKSLLQSVTKHKERKGRNIGVLELLLIFTLALLGVWAFLVYDMLTVRSVQACLHKTHDLSQRQRFAVLGLFPTCPDPPQPAAAAMPCLALL